MKLCILLLLVVLLHKQNLKAKKCNCITNKLIHTGSTFGRRGWLISKNKLYISIYWAFCLYVMKSVINPLRLTGCFNISINVLYSTDRSVDTKRLGTRTVGHLSQIPEPFQTSSFSVTCATHFSFNFHK